MSFQASNSRCTKQHTHTHTHTRAHDNTHQEEEEDDLSDVSLDEEKPKKRKAPATKGPADKKAKPPPARKIIEIEVLEDGWTAHPPSLLYK